MDRLDESRRTSGYIKSSCTLFGNMTRPKDSTTSHLGLDDASDSSDIHCVLTLISSDMPCDAIADGRRRASCPTTCWWVWLRRVKSWPDAWTLAGITCKTTSPTTRTSWSLSVLEMQKLGSIWIYCIILIYDTVCFTTFYNIRMILYVLQLYMYLSYVYIYIYIYIYVYVYVYVYRYIYIYIYTLVYNYEFCVVHPCWDL